MIARRLEIRGHVQGVFFRESMRAEAARLGVTGWVRNRKDGSVEAFVQGEKEAVDELETWAQEGPPAARVENVRAENAKPDASITDFKRLPTG